MWFLTHITPLKKGKAQNVWNLLQIFGTFDLNFYFFNCTCASPEVLQHTNHIILLFLLANRGLEHARV